MILKTYVIPSDIITLIQNLYEDSRSVVKWLATIRLWLSEMRRRLLTCCTYRNDSCMLLLMLAHDMYVTAKFSVYRTQ